MIRLPSSLDRDRLSRPRAVFFDVDGTLVNAAGAVTERVIEAVGRLSKEGVAVAIASGRPWFGSRAVISSIKATGMSLFYSGALLCNPRSGAVLHAEAVPFAEARDVVALCRQQGLHVEWYTAEEYFAEEETALGLVHAEYLGHPPRIEKFPSSEGEPLLKIAMMLRSDTEEASVRTIAAGCPHLALTVARGAAHPEISFANLTARGASRERAFERLLRHYRIDAQEVISLGDAEADVPFLERAGWSFAMGSAPDSVKARSRFITASVEDDGVALAIEAILAVL